MKVTKRILALVMTMLMILGTCAVAASAAGDLQSMINAASGTVTMTGDTIESVVIDKDLTLDLGGYELRGVPGSPAITINGANVTITNGRVVSQFADVKSLTMMEKVVDESPAAILVNGGSVTVEGVRAMGGLTRVPTTSGRYLPTGNAIALLDGASATITQSSLVGRYGVNNKVTNNPAGGTVTINDAIILGFMRAVKDSSKEELGDTTLKENVADHIEGFLSKGVKLEDRERNMLKRVFAERAIVYTKAVQGNPLFTYNECTEKYTVSARVDESNLWKNNTSTDCSYKYVPEYVVLADGTLVEMTEHEDDEGPLYLAEVEEDQTDELQVKYRTWFDMQPDVKEMADNFEPYLQAVVNDAIDGVNKLYDFSLEKYTTYTKLVGDIANKLAAAGTEEINGRAIKDLDIYKRLIRAIYDLGGKTVWEASHEGYTFGNNQMRNIYGEGATMPADGIVGTIDRVAKLKDELEGFLPFEDQSKWADLAYWAYENYTEVLDIVDEAVERLAALQAILDEDMVQTIVQTANLQDKRAQFDKVQQITNDANAVLDRFMASSTVKYFIGKADTHKSELKPYVNKFISIYNHLDRYFVPADFMDGNFAKGYAVYMDAEMDTDSIHHQYGDPTWDWAEDYSSATATFTCENCGHEEKLTDEQPSMEEVEPATCTSEQIVTYTATVLFMDEDYFDYKENVTGPEGMTDHVYGNPTWNWYNNYKDATATFKCDNCDHEEEIVADVDTTVVQEQSCTDERIVYHTAYVEFNEDTYTDTTENMKEKDAAGHKWATDYEAIDDAQHAIFCEVCSAKQDGSEEDHDYEDFQVTKEPTEEEPGSKIVQCTVCLHQMEVEIDPLPHVHVYTGPEWEWATDYSSATATFTCEKNDDEQKVTDNTIDAEELEEAECEKDQVVQYLASVEFGGETYETTSDPVSVPNTATSHAWPEKPNWVWNDTHTEATATFICGNNNEHQKVLTDSNPVMNEVSAANCTEPQKVTYTATVELDGKTYTDTTEEFDGEGATGHAWPEKPDWVWNDTHTQATATFICGNNDEHQEVRIDTAPVTNEISPATCTDPQKVTYTATVELDGKTYTDTTEEFDGEGPTGHAWPEKPNWVWNDTHTQATATFICGNNDEHQEVRIDTAPVTNEVSPANCTDPQKVTYTATVELDGKTYTDTTEEFDGEGPTGHSYGEPAWVWADDYSSATATFTCGNCGDKKTETDPQPVQTEVSPETCTDPQKVTYTATVTFNGGTYSKTTEVVDGKPSTGHAFGDWEDYNEENHIRYCQNNGCEAFETQAHTFTDWTVTTAPTATSDGEETRTCTVCGREESRPITEMPELLLFVNDSTEGANEVFVTTPYGRRGTTAFKLRASEDDVTYEMSLKGSKILAVDEDGNVTFVRLCLFCKTATITATTPDGRTATCEVKLKMKWWQIIVWLLLGSLWF